MKYISPLFFLLFIAYTLSAQKALLNDYATIDQKALKLPDSLSTNTDRIAQYMTAHFKTDKEKARAVFIWVANNIQYDIDHMFAINFYEKREEKIAKSLRTRKGICENYATLFTDICMKTGVRSYVIEGYTKQNGFADYIPHAWSAAFIDSSWFLFDPTWGSGYISGGKFVKKINNDYFQVSPAKLIKSHMPFDYLWQFLPYPVTSQEFYEGKTQQNNVKPLFGFADSIEVNEKLSPVDQWNLSAYRVEKNGVKNSLVFDRLQHLKLEIEKDKQNRIIELYNGAVVDYNDGINAFNEFIYYRNKQFTPPKTDPEIQKMLDEPDRKLKEAKSKVAQISNPDVNTANMIKQLTKSVDDALVQLKEHQDWLQLYFSKGKVGRKSMFYKVSLFGKPIN